MYISSDREEHIQNLQGILTQIGSTRQRVSKLIEEKLPKEERKLIDAEIVGNFMYLQSSIANQIRRLKERRD